METYDYEIDTIKIEKLKAMRRYRTFKNIANIVKTLEIFVAITIVFWSISWSSAYVPSAVNLAGAFLRRVSSLLFSPHFVFLIGNAIVITLFVKSGNSNQTTTTSSSVSENVAGENFSGEVPVVEEKRVSEDATVASPATETAIVSVKEEERESEVVAVEERTYRRSQSMVTVKEEKRELRRSVTEPRRKIGNRELSAAAARRRRMSEEDDLSGEEFRRKVEAFIAKQKGFLRQESQAVVLTNQSNSL